MNRNLVIGVAAIALIAVAVVAWLVFGSGGGTAETGGSGDHGVTITDADRTMGDPKAPIQFVEYAAPSCPHCARFNAEIFPFVKKRYIDTGKVFYIFRVFPIGQQDIPAEALARCMPKESYFAFIDLLFRKQEVWDPEYGITNVQAGLVEVANAAGMSQERAISCMQNEAEAKRINASAQDAIQKYNLNSTPSFVINGQLRQITFDQDSFKKLLDALLSKK